MFFIILLFPLNVKELFQAGCEMSKKSSGFRKPFKAWYSADPKIFMKISFSNSKKELQNNSLNKIIIIIYAFRDAIHSTTISQRAHIIITPVIRFNFNSALNTVHNFHSLRNTPASRHVTGAIMPIHATNNVRILPGTHLYTWVESSNVDKVSC